ncbi:hypothetical protein DICPUDRAFT_88906 [Dictyostelium purpureum]|uniref:dihydrofolate reductase n=1 Tax=Dictyostelium purpureum TaxID=5786 RepID=F0ZSE1_DICPU|nr:uncharacterized protein DICPUDRAFT_88906 [Dictyostelium purpureum]EGC33135.1 hypothetical protein DICPUDRAFT_88906 [Dictyostelium purpureum]|eukprot:XP_003290330.1 hypothetical protein DICPUDRAFT_88906 [Dictyostelium purpureum]
MKISIIVAVSKNFVIGSNPKGSKLGELPWHLPKDLKHFKETTHGFPCIIGRLTLEAFGDLLPNRFNIIVSKKEEFMNLRENKKIDLPEYEKGVTEKGASYVVVPTVEDGIHYADNTLKTDLVYIVGGKGIYETSQPYTHELIITDIDTHIDDTDVVVYNPFPSEEEKSKWIQVSQHHHPKDDQNNFDFSITYYKKKEEILINLPPPSPSFLKKHPILK